MLIKDHELESLINLIEDYDTIIIHRHVRPDPDAVGSQLGLKELLIHRYPDKLVLAAGTTSDGLAWLGEMDEINKADYKDALVIVIDTANEDRIDGALYHLGDKLVKIDHHLIVDTYGDLQIVYPEATSASQLIVEIAVRLGDKLPLTPVASEKLYAGIVADTGRFLYNPTPDTFEAAKYLVAQSIDTRAITDRFSEMTVNEARFQGYAYDNIVFHKGGVASLLITREIMEKFQISEEASNIVLNIPSDIVGMYAWVNFIEQEGNNPKYRVRLRSKGPEINGIAELHDGGGHAMASGAKANSPEELEIIINELKVATANYLAKMPKP